MVARKLEEALRVRLGLPHVYTPYADFRYEQQRKQRVRGKPATGTTGGQERVMFFLLFRASLPLFNGVGVHHSAKYVSRR